jgi:4-hydroxy-tetrahydrodipicolinate reductase
MGQEVVKALSQEQGTELVGAVDINVPRDFLESTGGVRVPLSSKLEHILDTCRPDVVVDFTIAESIRTAAPVVIKRGIHLVTGTSGLGANDLKQFDSLARANRIGVVVAANFALGAVLMVHLAQLTAKYLDYAEIIEQHHHLKVDSPSGTALATTRAMLEARDKAFNKPPGKARPSRGQVVDGVPIHSVRLPGILARQEVLLGGPGQTLSIKHEVINRECYMSGVMLAVKEVIRRQGLVYGLDAFLGL